MLSDRQKKALLLAAGLGTLGVGLGLSFALYRHPLTLTRWYTRRVLGLSGLRHVIEHHPEGKLSYFTRGAPQDTPKAVVVLVHGLGGDSGNWYKTIKCLRHHDIVALDLPGHGDSQLADQDWTAETLFALFCRLIDSATEDRPVILVGNSMGGWLSILYTLANPHRVQKLILVNSAGLQFPIRRNLLLPETRRDAQQMIESVFGDHAPRLPSFLLDSLIRQSHQSPIAHALEGVDHPSFIGDRLQEISVPTEIIWGNRDQIIPWEHAERFLHNIPDARLHLIDGAGHSPQVGSPREFNQLLSRILRPALDTSVY